MKHLLLSAVLFSSCATLRSKTYCGNVDTLAVHVKQDALPCKVAMRVTNKAYELLWQKAAAPLNEPWHVEYTWGAIDISNPWARIYPDKHLILVQSDAPHSVFHELLHAYMTETQTGGRSQHQKMCANKVWQKLEKDFNVKPYCHFQF